MLYDITLFVALAVFGTGLLYRISGWIRLDIDLPAAGRANPSPHRVRTALKGLLAVLFSTRLFTVLKVFFKDVIVQLQILKEDFLRWLMHMLIFYGFMFLFFTHALDKIIVTSLFDKYYLRLNPFLLAAGGMVLAGIAISVLRRSLLKVPRLKTTFNDSYALVILAVIILSGLAMELTKLSSYTHYQKFWTIHILSTFLGLALVPFSKMFHVFSTPLSLFANAVMDQNSDPANIKTRQMMELDACTRCGTCSRRCSVAVAFDSIGNALILPSERMTFLKDYYADKQISARGLRAIEQGIVLCTNCDRCTVACPAGINLRDLWFNVREEIIRKKTGSALLLTPFSYFRGLRRQGFDPEPYDKPVADVQRKITSPYPLIGRTDHVIPLTPQNRAFGKSADLPDSARTYAYCFACENCSTVCPVVGHYDDPQQHLDLMPHQIMRAMGFGIRDLAMGSRMLWNCLTCYQCQEHCPQGVKVTDILYELKTLSVKEFSHA